MQQIWHFSHPDTWTPLTEEPFAWADGTDCNAALTNAGYSCYTQLGIEECVGMTEIWSTDKPENKYPYLLMLNLPGSWVATVAIADVPGLMAYLAKYGGMSLATMHEEFYTWFSRTFHKFHEHDTWEVCHECDPGEVRLRERKRAEARARKAAQVSK